LSLGFSICGYLLYAPIKTRHWTHFMEQNGKVRTAPLQIRSKYLMEIRFLLIP
jgi:hypothetical protein